MQPLLEGGESDRNDLSRPCFHLPHPLVSVINNYHHLIINWKPRSLVWLVAAQVTGHPKTLLAGNRFLFILEELSHSLLFSVPSPSKDCRQEVKKKQFAMRFAISIHHL